MRMSQSGGQNPTSTVARRAGITLTYTRSSDRVWIALMRMIFQVLIMSIKRLLKITQNIIGMLSSIHQLASFMTSPMTLMISTTTTMCNMISSSITNSVTTTVNMTAMQTMQA